MWIVYAILSAIGLGFYDIAKKQSLRDRSVPAVLTLSVCFSSLLLLPLLLISRLQPEWLQDTLFYVPQATGEEHFYIFLKAALVLSSWVFAYMSMKHLPITLVTPINATRPMWTLVGAVLLFGETLNAWQWAGVTVALLSFFAFSQVGKGEGISWHHNVWLYALLLATLLGACSGLYDKHLMRRMDHNAVLVYYTFYQALLMLVYMLVTRTIKARKEGKSLSLTLPRSLRLRTPSILLISIFLISADFVYLLALSDPDSLISIVSTVRRCGCVIPFLYGALFLHDKNVKRKAICLSGVMLGLVFLLLGTL